MKRWLWVCTSILISTGVYFTIRYGLRPKPIPVLNATEFSDPAQIGAVVYKRLRQEIRGERVLLLGSTPELFGYEDVWTGLLKTAISDEVKIAVLFQREGLKPINVASLTEVVPFTEAMLHSGELETLIKDRLASGHLIVVHGKATELTHLNRESLSRRLDSVLQRPVLSISNLFLSLNPEDQMTLQNQCSDSPLEGRLACAEARMGKILIRKKLSTGVDWAVMEQHGLKEYLLFVHH